MIHPEHICAHPCEDKRCRDCDCRMDSDHDEPCCDACTETNLIESYKAGEL